MQWNSVSEFLSMGGYAFYVWGSFGLTAAVLVAEILLVRQQRNQILRNLRGERRSESNSS